jgi:outer membrane protein assembly factor BamB
MNLIRFIAITTLATAFANAADWPQFRGPTGQGIADTRGLPTTWSTTNNVAWKQPIPGGGWSSPIVWRGRIFLTTAVTPERGGNVSLRALCLDERSGNVVWDSDVFSVVPVAGHKKNSQASPTPLTDGARLYVHFGQYGTAALDLAGRILWRQTALKYPPVHGNGGSPALAGDALVFSCDGASNPFVAALNKATGELLWKTPREQAVGKTFSFSTPLVITNAGRAQVISPGSGAVMSYDPATGRELWRARYGEGYSVVPRPVFGHGLLYLSSSFDRPVTHAIRPDGTGDVTDTHIAWKISKGAPNTPSMLLVGNELYFLSDAGVMTCADAKNGETHWQERLDGGVSASPVFADGKIFSVNEEGVTTVLKPGKNFQVLARNDLQERALASPAAVDGALLIRTAAHLWRIEQKSR